MTYQKFAKDCGCRITRCEPRWGGTYAYYQKTSPDSLTCGFKDQDSAYSSYLKNTFGISPARALFKLFKRIEQIESRDPLPQEIES